MSIYIIGELNADMIISGNDIMPEWNREKLVQSFSTVLGSSSAITACALAGLGLDVKFVSVVGHDDLGHFCIRKLQDKGVDTTHVRMDPTLNTGVTLSFSAPADRGLITYLGSIASVEPSLIPSTLFDEAIHLHFGSYFLQEKMQEHWAGLFQEARKRGISTSFDLGWDIHGKWQQESVSTLLAHTDLFMPSEEECKHLYGVETLDELILALPESRQSVLIKRGSQGATLLAPNGDRTDVSAYELVPVDTTGAGDSFNAGAIYGYLKGMRGEELLLFAGACGGASTQRLGGAESVSSYEELIRFQQTHRLKLSNC